MEFSCQKGDLLKAVSAATRLAATKSTLPILHNILLEAKKDKVLIRATDLEQTVEITIPATVKSNGNLTIPARLINDYLANNSDQQINVIGDDTTLKVNSPNHIASIKGVTADDYPIMPEFNGKETINFSFNELKKKLERVVFAAASDETRPVLNSVLLNLADRKLEIVATDGYRLAREIYEVGNSSADGLKVIIPKRAIIELLRITYDSTESMRVVIAPNQVCFDFGDVKLFSRLLDGSYPDYAAILPKDKGTTTTVSVGALLQAFRLASLFSRDSAYSTKLEIAGSVLRVTAISPQLGQNSNEVALTNPVKTPVTVSVNAQYIIDLLSVMSGDIELSINNPKSPIVFSLPQKNDYVYLVMPLRNE